MESTCLKIWCGFTFWVSNVSSFGLLIRPPFPDLYIGCLILPVLRSVVVNLFWLILSWSSRLKAGGTVRKLTGVPWPNLSRVGPGKKFGIVTFKGSRKPPQPRVCSRPCSKLGCIGVFLCKVRRCVVWKRYSPVVQLLNLFHCLHIDISHLRNSRWGWRYAVCPGVCFSRFLLCGRICGRTSILKFGICCVCWCCHCDSIGHYLSHSIRDRFQCIVGTRVFNWW